MQSVLEAALLYREKFGFSVVPVRTDKKPHVKWEEYQQKKATPDEIREWWKKWPDAGVAIITGSISGIGVIDIDEEIGHAKLEAELPPEVFGYFPTVRSARGGTHYYFKINGTPAPTKSRFLEGVDMRGEGGYIIAPPTRRPEGVYEWEEGGSLLKHEPPALPSAFLEKARAAKSHYARKGQPKTTEDRQEPPTGQDEAWELFAKGTRDDDLFHTALLLGRGGAEKWKTDQIINKLAVGCGFPPDEARIKVDSAYARLNERSIRTEVREFVEKSTGVFTTRDLYSELGYTDRKEKHGATDFLQVLVKEDFIEKCGGKFGHYRRIEDRAEEMDIQNAKDTEYDIVLPFGLNKLVRVQPKNILVFAGTSNSGKTAALLNIVKDNMTHQDLAYFNSEMDPTELRDRLKRFDVPWDYWKHFRPKERNSNFADVIKPNALNIIDYLEIVEDFFNVDKFLTAIHAKLKGGIAVVAMQKKEGSRVGIGGSGGLNKPRLYITMEGRDNSVTIQKAKLRRNPEFNPNGKTTHFKLVNGVKFIPAKVDQFGTYTTEEYEWA